MFTTFFRVLGAPPRGIDRFGANSKGQGITGDTQAVRPWVLAPESALRFRPRIALFSGRVSKSYTTSRLPVQDTQTGPVQPVVSTKLGGGLAEPSVPEARVGSGQRAS